MQKGFNIGWNVGQSDERKLEKIISKPWASDGKNFSERIWQSRTSLFNELHQQLTRTCILGKPPDDAIRVISKKFNVAKNQAGRLVMTEQAYFHSVAQQEAFEELDVEEFEIVATLDSHTSEICREMDGKHFPMKDYEPGVTAPPFHVWCRSVTVPYFDDDFDVGGERAARDEDGKTYYVPADMTYKKWHEKFVENYDDNVETGILKQQEYDDIIEKIRKDIQTTQPLEIEVGKQGKHILGHNNYMKGKSYLTISLDEAQELVNKYAGTGEINLNAKGEWDRKEIIKTDKEIGVNVSFLDGSEKRTNSFKIHYSKKGTHIVPY